MHKTLLAAAVLVGLTGCTSEPAPLPAPESTAAPSSEVVTAPAAESTAAARIGDWGIDIAQVSDRVAAGDDFFAYVNQGWLDSNEIPAGFSRFGAFTELSLASEERVAAIISEAADADAEPGSPLQQIAAMHGAFMNTERIEALGLEPIRAELDALLALDSHDEVARWMARNGTGSIIGAFVTLDSGNPERYLVHLGQSGLGLPDKDYYEREDAPFPDHRSAYVDYIAATFERAGIDAPRERADAVMALETAIADAHWTRTQRRDREANYNRMTLEEVKVFAPGFPWDVMLEERRLDGIEEVVVGTDTAIQQLAALFSDTPVETWASWHAFHWINNHASLLSDAWADARFAFYETRLDGVEEQRPRDRRAIQFVSARMGEQVGQVYVARHFPPESREQMLELVGYLGRAFGERLNALDWMDEATRTEALAKLEAFSPKIGYPDRWNDFGSVEIRADDLIGNVARLADWYWNDSLAKLDEPVRTWEWFMSPQRVNAYYSSARNEIVFPAGILQPPFFDPNADPAVNFGAIGGVIGHEMGHGFDDQGSKSDARGVLRDWWTAESRARFETLAGRLADQYDQYEPVEGMTINGRLSLGENIGDLGGLAIAYHAYRMYVDEHFGGEAPVLDGYTGDQRFFMAWAQVWRNLQTEDSLRSQLVRGPHSPAPYRVNGIVRNMDAWYDAFGVTEGHELYLLPEERLSIW
ncbi:M13 family metallopeptidase [Wenzhouxiangella sp. XN79A]|uniref:M13 family metallopeptidase n=1 Tax=Wenzhouxiangella sp. XN79A TaxID=2724193 RepID=UPI00144AE097|nr:M13 family metallopeptidase [Wenzhouxiangella sp. XN79A]NKI36543.1 M13 family metallopeptidase [Wenzhouxiangella sp. XN79A]